ncbi:glutamate-5-semialdehyde dehydrogenase [Mucilaginibacter myungsuensis]|uniref:Gamma-glutamyl phosphate reductase n=1 Tax=Mucilaginibacter myungsuensis TaxID=649104 RepID=A0A929PX06_9SPHI|nr:glutamate-5-semialdehyde dehydrogenase [Mucilaginibacter myungsuensis]MBE9663378.1 glutamate-5-semialdehyde dehydrogenase [Mucilaginibacter myungsuensis]MDN3600115.1 glutamate-5-semialdehyde dehydrogenase [Mucilaginibacter myungsuensis]
MSYTTYFEKAVAAQKVFLGLTKERITEVLLALADGLIAHTDAIISANQQDLDRMDPADAKYDRLKLTPQRIEDIAAEVRNVANLESPVGRVLEEKDMPNGLHIAKVSVPLGVVGVIYEARPNVTVDVFSLCFKTGNVAVLKGGSDASYTNEAIYEVIHHVLGDNGINADVVVLLPAEREATEALLNASGYVDVLIPRGSQGLINYVRQNSKVPVIETGAGIVHTYGDASADADMLGKIVFNSKTRRPSVCNTLDCLIVHQDLLPLLGQIAAPLIDKQVQLFADEASYQALDGSYPAELLLPAEPEHFGTEFLSLKMAIKTVASLGEALDHISRYGSKHSEAIVSQDPDNIERFLNSVDAAAVYANTSTAFTDGAQFGLGAEIGISTQKLHARGPMGLAELTSYKWVVRGNGQTRS